MNRFWCRNCNHANSNDLVNESNYFGHVWTIASKYLLQNRVAILEPDVAIHRAAAHPDEVIHVAPSHLGEAALLQLCILRRVICHIVEMISC